MERFINNKWVSCDKSDLVNGDKYRDTTSSGAIKTTYYYEKSKSDIEREWRDSELKLTDWVVPVTDHPQHAAYLTYRQALRDYPLQVDFPNGTRPSL